MEAGLDPRRLKVVARDVESDASLTPERGWHDMDVKWLLTERTVGARKTVVGTTLFPPGAKHDLHRHPNAEEWEYVLQGQGRKRIGDAIVELKAGELAFVPQDVYHSLENVSATEVLITLWGYSGAGSLEEAGYVIPTDEEVALGGA